MVDNPCNNVLPDNFTLYDNCLCTLITNMTDVYTWDGTKYQSCLFIDGDTEDCQDGDGAGGTEAWVGYLTKEDCIETVRKTDANGITISNPCDGECECLAEFGMTYRLNVNGQDYQTCEVQSVQDSEASP